MKTIKNIALLVSVALLCSFTGKEEKNGKGGEIPAEHTNVVLNMIGHVENAGFDFKNAKYRLYRNNNFVAGGITDRFGALELPLMRNSRYLLELSAPGFVPKKVYISTFVPDNHKGTGLFDFNIYLVPRDMLTDEEACMLEVPYAIVYFNRESKEFDYDKEYTEQRSRVEEELLQ
jgi:hypothetical protein